MIQISFCLINDIPQRRRMLAWDYVKFIIFSFFKELNFIADILMENENSLHKCPDCNKEAYMKLNEILD